MIDEILHEFRESGYLSQHSDYIIKGKMATSWTFTHPDGHWVGDTGATDLDVLRSCQDKIALMSMEAGFLPNKTDKVLVSPFRYPGAKARHMSMICGISNFSGLAGLRYVEPFAGGGSALFYLLSRYGTPREVVMNDFDTSVSSFWMCMESKKNKDDLLLKIKSADVTIEERNIQRGLMDSTNIVEAAFAGIFISRTSFSGIMRENVGPIGGKSQKSAYPVDCRFTADTLIERIEKIFKSLNGVIKGSSIDFQEVIEKHDEEGVVIYCDPPYYDKGNALYREGMSIADHIRLRDALKSVKKARFILSYDDCDEIRDLYRGFKIDKLNALYSVAIGKESRKTGKEVVITR